MPDDSSNPSIDNGSSYNGRDSSKSGGQSQWRSSKSAGALRSAGSSLSASGQQMISDSRDDAHVGPVQYRKGGKVRKTGPAIVHRGERIIPKSKVKRVEKMMKRKKMRMKARS